MPADVGLGGLQRRHDPECDAGADRDASRNRNAVQSRPISNARGIWDAASVTSTLVTASAMKTAATLAASASTMLSVRNCVKRRPRPAPRAVRTATSRFRPSARTSSRFATLAQAISKTIATAPSKVSTPVRERPTTASVSGIIGTVRSGFDCRSGSMRRQWRAVPLAAASIVTPGFTRPTATSMR